MNRLWLMAMPLMFVLVGCAASSPTKPAARSTVTLVPDNRLHGRIATINAPGQFAVVDFNVGGVPPLQAEMNVYRSNAIVGVVRLTGPVRDNLVAADIVKGELVVGDRAIWDRDKPAEKNGEAAQP